MIAISSDELKIRLARILTKYNFSKTDADLCAFIFTENTLAGIASHGVNRFPEFIDLVNRGFIKPASKPTLLNSFNGLEQWDGNYGPGPKNAWLITDKVLNLAEKFGIGCITLKNTNHWMRAATYGWKAAEKGFVFICWTNTIPNLPPWGAKESTTGNNPIVFAFPRKDGPVVLDMALSQFSYGKLSDYKTDGKLLPLDGGYDTKGELTKVPDEIIKSQRPLPVGFWKGSGLSLLLDLIATTLAGGKSTFDMSKYDVDYGMSQMFIAINPANFSSGEAINAITEQIIRYYKSAERIERNEIFYPGERALKTKEKFLKNGIPINKRIWEKISEL